MTGTLPHPTPDAVTTPSTPLRDLNAALVHDWLTVYGGAERVLEQLLEVLPRADVFSPLNILPDGDDAFLGGRDVTTSFLQRLPFLRRHYQKYMPLVPLAVEGFDCSSYDLVVSSSFLAAKGVLAGPDQLHVCYQHSPARYAWDQQFEYLAQGGYDRGAKRLVARALLHYLRLHDVASSNRVDLYVANSRWVAHRIWRAYRRRAEVVPPPVDTERFSLATEKDDYYVTVGRLMPYKRADVLVEAFRDMPRRKLVVIGEGPQYDALVAAAPPNVSVLGHQDSESVHRHLRHARAFLFAAREDFGIAPVEAQACGTPVIAFGAGGALETVVPGRTGVFFPEQTAEAVRHAVEAFEPERLDPSEIRRHAERFSAAAFRSRMGEVLERARSEFALDNHVGPSSPPALVPTSDDGARPAPTPRPAPTYWPSWRPADSPVKLPRS